MARGALMTAIEKLAIAGQQAGFSLEQMIDVLNAGLSVETLLDLIAWRLEGTQSAWPLLGSSSNWVVPRRSASA
jgi:hypothetical protein